MKPGRYKSTGRKRVKDTVTPPASNGSPTSPNQGVNVDNSVRDGSPHQMVRDVIVLASTSSHLADMTSSPKKTKGEDDGKQKKACQEDHKYKSPFVEGCAKKFERITKSLRLVVDYALDVNGVERIFGS